MANRTDPLAAAVHGTDPQNLMEYIVRQKIYDTRYWKEECFGLTAADVLEKTTQLKCFGASFGGNAKPTKFLCLTLKLLQIQPPQDLIDAFLETEDFKYVRVLGAFYRRLTGRPAQIYESLEPYYTDYRKLRYRNVTEWNETTVDQFIHDLLTQERVCGISLPRLPARSILVQEGYLDDDYQSPVLAVVGTDSALEDYLYQKVQQGSVAAKALWEQRLTQKQKRLQEERQREAVLKRTRNEKDDDRRTDSQDSSRKKLKKDPPSYGNLFKKNPTAAPPVADSSIHSTAGPKPGLDENSEEYWNVQRAKLGLKPLRK
jgi:pre-mRNA-splicing factor 38A